MKDKIECPWCGALNEVLPLLENETPTVPTVLECVCWYCNKRYGQTNMSTRGVKVWFDGRKLTISDR